VSFIVNVVQKTWNVIVNFIEITKICKLSEITNTTYYELVIFVSLYYILVLHFVVELVAIFRQL
jgi:hypothetical protein